MEQEKQVIKSDSQGERPTRSFQINGCSVTATFQPSGQGADLEYVRRLLASTFVQKYDAKKP